MSVLKNLAKLSKITLPSGNTYRLQDNDLREMVGLVAYVENVAYEANQIIYNANEDAVYRVMTAITASENTSFEDIASKVSLTDITNEIETRYNEIKALIAGGTHYRGYTTTALTDGATTNPIIINGAEYTAESGDIVIYQLVDQYQSTKDQEFIFNGTIWNEFGSTGVLKALAFVDTASGPYTAPVGTGTVTINAYDIEGGKTTTITGEGTTDIPYVDELGGTQTFNTDAVKNVELTGTKTFVTNAVKDLELTGTGRTFTTNGIKAVSLTDDGTDKTTVTVVKGLTVSNTLVYNTDAIKNAVLTSSAETNTVVTGLTGTTSFAPTAITATVSDEELIFTTVTNATFGVNTTDLGITTTAASTGTFELQTKTIGLNPTNSDTDSFGITYTMTEGTTANYGTVGVTSEAAATGTVTVTPKHIHITHTTPTANVTVDTETRTVTVSPTVTV